VPDQATATAEKTDADEQNQAAESANGAAASAAAQQQQTADSQGGASADGGEGGDGGQQVDPVDLFLKLTESDEGKSLIGAAAAYFNDQPAGEAAKPAEAKPAAATGERAELERKADEGDGDAAIELRRLEKSEKAQEDQASKYRHEQKIVAFGEILAEAGGESIPEETRKRIGVTLLSKGVGAATAELLKHVRGANGADGTAEQQEARAKQNGEIAAKNREPGSASLPGAEAQSGPGPIEFGQSVTDVFDRLFSWQETNN